ncbi:unnamed protein product [Linum tenue]|uniref:Uncharacterized protein n=1 Tax=Linum tenue TaxID=586396 RepID=A0AAV0LHH8_9ROSI|nr:unnamed protein product [Linum tenue]
MQGVIPALSQIWSSTCFLAETIGAPDGS